MGIFTSSVLMFIFIRHFGVKGQCDNNTRPLILLASRYPDYFTSPNYPNNYPKNADCAWLIEAPSKYDKIIINIQRLFTQNYEYLTMYEGNSTSGTLVWQVDNRNEATHNVYVSNGSTLYFSFITDNAWQYEGFQVLYFSNDTVAQPACGTTLNVSSTEQVLMSRNLPNVYTASHSCYWYLKSSKVTIEFQIRLLDMGKCSGESFTIYDGPDNTSDELAKECNTASVYTYSADVSKGKSASIYWLVGNNTNPFYGFMLTYKQSETTSDPDTVIGSTCESDEDCSGIDNSECSNEECTCAAGFIQDGDTCTQVLGLYCDIEEDCTLHVTYSECQSNICGCKTGYMEINSDCSRVLGGSCSNLKTITCSDVVPHSECRSSVCTCSSGYIEQSDTCISGIGMSCTNSHMCQLVVPNTVCNKRICSCSDGYKNGTASCTKALSSLCSSTSECSDYVTNSECSNFKCKCVSGYVEENTECAKGVSAECSSSTECVSHASCIGGKCLCDEGYRKNNGLCQKIIGGPCSYTIDCKRYDDNSNCIIGMCRCNTDFVESDTFCVSDARKLFADSWKILAIVTVVTVVLTG